MNEREIEQTVELLHRYFDEANPSDPAGNIRLIKRLAGFRFSEQAGRLILLAPAVILDGLHGLVEQQFMQALSGIREDQLDYQLKAIGLALVMEYAHLIQAAGSGGVMSVVSMLPVLVQQGQEDGATLAALALSFLVANSDVMTSIALKSSVESGAFQDVYDRAYNSATRIALAYLLFELGRREPFKSYAAPRISTPDRRHVLEANLQPGNPRLRAAVMELVLLDVASAGRALPRKLNWQRRDRG